MININKVHMWAEISKTSISASKRLNSTCSKITSNTIITTLANGFKVATNNNVKINHEVVAMGLYVNAGSRYESNNSYLGLKPGVGKLLEKLSFRDTANLSFTDMSNKLELLGGNYQCVTNRDSIMYQASCINMGSQVPDLLSLLKETVINPRFDAQQLNDLKEILTMDSLLNTPAQKDLILPELLHQKAFSNETLGSQLSITDPTILESITVADIYKYHQMLFTPSNMTLAIVGLKHDDALKLANALFADLSNQPVISPEQAVYTPNKSLAIEKKAPINNPLETFSHVAIGYSTLPIEHSDIYTVAVLQSVLGGGSSFSSGGPGKGLYSRLYTQVLGRYGWVDHCSSFNYAYKDTGLIGIMCSVEDNATGVVGELLAQQFYNLCHPMIQNDPKSNRDGINDEQVQRGKKQLKSSLLMGLESKVVELEDMGRQVSMLGNRVPVEEMLSKIDNVTLDDCKRVSIDLFVKGKGPTIIMQGEKDKFGDILSTFKEYGLSTNK
ncbi:hypothetical protein QEN19_001553 [Hanseniaspora menglaensis]